MATLDELARMLVPGKTGWHIVPGACPNTFYVVSGQIPDAVIIGRFDSKAKALEFVRAYAPSA